jgi:tRNA dimethylallyltransferase
LAILGPTASGKTDLAIHVADRLGAEIVSVDSMQVYRGMDIGTAKPTLIERRGITHHLIDVADPEEDFTVARFARMGRQVMAAAGGPLVITGGSGLHFRALVDPMSFAPTDPGLRASLEAEAPESLVERLSAADPDVMTHVDLANHRRVVRALEVFELTGATPTSRAKTAEAKDLRRYVAEIPFVAVGVDPGGMMDERVDRRLAEMRQGGWVEEVRALWHRMGRTARTAVGYPEMAAHAEGRVDADTAFRDAARATKRLAKKQRTWFQRDPRIRWIPWLDDPEDRARRVMETLD